MTIHAYTFVSLTRLPNISVLMVDTQGVTRQEKNGLYGCVTILLLL